MHTSLRMIWSGFESLWGYKSLLYLIYAEVAQLVEHDLAKVRVAGSNPVFRSAVILNGSKVPLGGSSNDQGKEFDSLSCWVPKRGGLPG